MPVNPRSVLFGLVLPFLLSTPSSALAALHRQPLTAQPQDPFATPKFQVSFLNRRPISESEAQAWQENITTGQEFDPVEAFVRGSAHAMMHADAVGRKTIGESTSSQPRPNVVKLRLPSPSSATGSSAVHDYLCLVPSPPMLHPSKDAEAAAREEAMARAAEETPDPNIGWESLQHLNGRCLYTRQGWFSYSYCHNSHVRQFREAPHSHPHPPGGLIPQEDHEVSRVVNSNMPLNCTEPEFRPSTRGTT
jgi:protein OS-9